jgi:hypothetical protein
LLGTDLDKADIGSTGFGGLDLSAVRGLEGVNHSGPTTVGVDTLTASKGLIPDRFLRGCGFTPWQILEAKLHNPALTAARIRELQDKIFDARTPGQTHLGGVFISYSRVDFQFVDKLKNRLEKSGASVWLDRHSMVAGSIQKQVARAIRINDVVLLVLSKNSVESNWVTAELAMARQKENEQKRDVLCPVTLDKKCLPEMESRHRDSELWQTVEKMNMLDFSNWQDDGQFEEQFARLLRGMKIYYEAKK